MKSLRDKLIILATAAAIFAVLSGCSNEEPAVIFDPNATGAATPEITAVDPSDRAVAGVTRVTITGRNFSPVVGENFVYFNTFKATVLAAAATELTVIPPPIVATSLKIRVVVQNAFLSAEYAQPYTLESISTPYGQLGRVRAITMDANENLFASPTSGVVKLSLDGQMTTYGTLSFPTTSAMRMGPGGFLYVQRNANVNFYRIAPGGGADAVFVRFSQAVSFFDFDQNGNAYAGGNNGLFVVNPGRTIKSVGQYQGIPITSVRVFNGFVYVATAGASPGVWKNQILAADGSLGNNEPVFNWANAGEFSGFTISDVTFALDGDMYIAAANKTLDPILVVHPDGTAETLYPGVLNFPVTDFVWGNEQFLYVNHETDAGVSRIAMGKPGAPYLGRQ
jgi:hypothetical protein